MKVSYALIVAGLVLGMTSAFADCYSKAYQRAVGYAEGAHRNEKGYTGCTETPEQKQANEVLSNNTFNIQLTCDNQFLPTIMVWVTKPTANGACKVIKAKEMIDKD